MLLMINKVRIPINNSIPILPSGLVHEGLRKSDYTAKLSFFVNIAK